MICMELNQELIPIFQVFCVVAYSYVGMASTIFYSTIGSCEATYSSLPVVSLACSCV